MEREENQNQVSLSSHSPWKSLSRFPHSHSPDHCLIPNERSPRGGSLRSRLQAHSSMRKCSYHAAGCSPRKTILIITINAKRYPSCLDEALAAKGLSIGAP